MFEVAGGQLPYHDNDHYNSVHVSGRKFTAFKKSLKDATKNNLSNIRVAHPDEVDANIRFTHIWSNPPIRIGKDALHELLLTWLHRLTDDGIAHLVVSKNLGADSLATWLINNGFATTRIGSSKGFRVLEVLAHR